MLSCLVHSFPRSETIAQHPLQTDGGARITEFLPPDHEHDEFRVRQTVLKKKLDKFKATQGDSAKSPPLCHWHLHKDEYFYVEKGSILLKIDGEDHIITAKDRVIEIKAGVYHSFDIDPNSNEDLVWVAYVEPEDGLTEKFFRNAFGYLDDCQNKRITPNLFQLLVFLYHDGTFVALPRLPKFLGKWLSRWVFGYFGGRVIGEKLLGFKDNYPEYFLSQDSGTGKNSDKKTE